MCVRVVGVCCGGVQLTLIRSDRACVAVQVCRPHLFGVPATVHIQWGSMTGVTQLAPTR
jgi:hypothetical protein